MVQTVEVSRVRMCVAVIESLLTFSKMNFEFLLESWYRVSCPSVLDLLNIEWCQMNRVVESKGLSLGLGTAA